MRHYRTLLMAATLGLLSLGAIAQPATAEQWHFWVTNNSTGTIKRLLVSEDGKQWGYFSIGSGIPRGKTTKLVWSEETDSESCVQWIKAEFSNGDQSTPTQFDFCKDLDDPIVFE